jgi:hypothetical protein
MAQSGVGSLITIVGGGLLAWWAYENFFAGPAAPATPAPGPAGGGAGTNLVPNPNPPVPPAPPAGPCSGAGVLAPILAAVVADKGATYGENLPGTLTIDEWDWYGNRICTGVMDQFGVNADTLFPNADDRGGPLNWNAFKGYAQQHGLSAGLIPVDRPVPVFPGRGGVFPGRGRGHAYGRLRQLIGTNLARPWRVA